MCVGCLETGVQGSGVREYRSCVPRTVAGGGTFALETDNILDSVYLRELHLRYLTIMNPHKVENPHPYSQGFSPHR